MFGEKEKGTCNSVEGDQVRNVVSHSGGISGVSVS